MRVLFADRSDAASFATTSMTGASATQHCAVLPAHASAFVLGSLLLDHLYCAPNAMGSDADDLLRALDRWLLRHGASNE
jgi:hypothetical protein